jgi:branched-chain amino acid transport system permease protein
MFLQQLINGLTLGAVYALIAVGYTMVYGIVELINFAHGEIYMMATFVAMTIFRLAGYPLWIAAPAAVVVAMIMGVTLEYIAYRPLRRSPRLVALISAIGASLFLQNLAMKIWGARRQPFLDPERPLPFFQVKHHLVLPVLGEATFSNMQLTILGTAVAMVIFLTLLIHRTKLGRAMRACAQDQVAAKLMGVNVDRTISATFAIGSAMALGDGRGGRRSRRHELQPGVADDGVHGGVEGVHGGGPGRHRQHAGGIRRGIGPGAGGGLRRRVHIVAVDGRHRLRHPDNRTDLPPLGDLGENDPAEDVTCAV